ncbi:MAG: alpha-hydroxy-acid oxidizing protein, partial [Gammaproteobacteria bacterium]
MTPITCNEDLRRLARRRVPRALFDYVDRGSYDEATLRANRTDLDALKLRQRVMLDVSQRTLATTLVGEPVAMPVALAPTGLTGLVHADGEILAARAAQQFGVPFTLSTVSICSIEAVRAAVTQPFWFQLYVMRDRGFAASLIERAKAAQCSALVLTADLQIQGQRHRDIKNGLTVPPRLTLGNALDLASKPRWALGMLRTKHRNFGNLAEVIARDGSSMTTLAQWIAGQFDPALSWKDVAWVRSLWPGKLIIKGILDREDARHAVDAGADAIVVSNHGGRQLDGAPSSIAALPGIVDSIGARAEVLLDGGVRSGQDALKAMALGARGVLIGKAFMYGLGALGQAGVTKALELIRNEL